jgi:hypothetical protein
MLGHKSIVLAIAMAASIPALFIGGIVSFKFIKRHRKGQQSTKNAIKILLSQDIELLFCSNAIASSPLTETITPNNDSR